MNRAIVIGIDDYRLAPLSSAVNDAIAFARALIELGLVAASEVTLLTSPGSGARKDDIKDAIKSVYRDTGTIDRLYFFFAGHGLLVYDDGGRTMPRTALLASDVRSLDDDGDKLIVFDELLEMLNVSGPKEQIFVIDACRNLPYKQSPPSVGRLGLTAAPPGPERAQAALYAVSKLGEALAVPGEHGVMTKHLLLGLRGDEIAKEYDLDADAYVVTPESLHRYLVDKVALALKEIPQWKRKYLEPKLDARGGARLPLRILRDVSDAPFAVHITPDEAGPHTRVELSLGGVALPHGLPPRRNHEAFSLPPQRYSVKVTSEAGTPEPARQVVDLRSTHELHVVVRGDATPGGRSSTVLTEPVVSASIEAAPDAAAAREALVVPDPGSPDHVPGVLRAVAHEHATVIHLESLSAPRITKEAAGILEETLPAGPYRVTFRLGNETFSEKDVFVLAGEHLEITPTPVGSALLREVLDELPGGGSASTVTLSPAIGPIQAAVLPTLLPLLGLSQFNARFLDRLDDRIPQLDPASFQLRPVTVVVALEGEWPAPAAEVLAGTSVSWVPDFDGSGQPSFAVPLTPIRRTAVQEAAAVDGFHRIGMASFAAPGAGFVSLVQLGAIGTLALATASLPRRATILHLTVYADGRFHVGQNLLRLSGQRYTEPNASQGSYAAVVRALQLGQQLYASGELAELGSSVNLVAELLCAKWTDPVLGCMGYHASRNTGQGGNRGLLRMAAANLWSYFAEVPDAQVIAAMEPALHGAATGVVHTPVLTASLRALVQLPSAAPSWQRLLRRIDPQQPWTCCWL